ncbi:alpha/beta hydrolase [Bremerella sp. JC770]|uniref:alpha/beta hydrolase n=1 Tax=Bremerella sp. JC770 TaxID=3232137 RepID=UPI003457727E
MTTHLKFLLTLLLIVTASRLSAEETTASKLEKDIPYRSETGLDDYAKRQCRVDIFTPAKKGFATVVWFHGGGLEGGDKKIPDYLMHNGYAVVSANYRHSPHVKAPVYLEDAAAAVAWTFANIEKYGGDPDKIFVSGHSAGGYLTSMLVLDKRWLKPHGIDPNDLAGAIPHSGQTLTHFTIRKERGLGRETGVADDLAPLHHVRQDTPPLLLTTGDRDLEIAFRYEENALLFKMLESIKHPDVELYELQGFDHGNMVQPGVLLMTKFINKHTKDD